MLTPRERAEAEPSKGSWRIARMYLEVPLEWRKQLAREIDAFAAEHVRALLADDEAIEAMVAALNNRSEGTLPGWAKDRQKKCASKMLAGLRRKALGE